MRRAPRSTVLVGAVLALAISATSAAAAALPSGNLIRNAGADDGPGAASFTELIVPPSWDPIDDSHQLITPVQYVVPESPTTVLSAPNYFAGGPSTFFASATQRIDLTPWARQIDAFGVRVNYGVSLGGWQTQDDEMNATLWSDPQGIRVDTMWGPNASERNNVTGFRRRFGSDQIYPETRSLRFDLTASRFAGEYNDGYADNIRVELVADRADRSPDTPVEHACENNQILIGVITSQPVRSVTTTMGTRRSVDTTKPFLTKFRQVSDAARGRINFRVVRPNGTTIPTPSVAIPGCEPPAPGR